MFDFLENLDVLHRSFWYVALFSSLVFVVQAVLTFIGSDSTDGTAPDFDGDFDGADGDFGAGDARRFPPLFGECFLGAGL